MAEMAAERLNRLQMADLGTARREYISTVDHKRIKSTRVEVIEATRRSNMPGSEEQRMAEANKSQLDRWANVHKEIGDTGDLEHLDDLLNGQSHRLQLNDVIREKGGQDYANSARANNNSFKAEGQKYVLPGPSKRTPSLSGNGATHAPESKRRPSKTYPKTATQAPKPLQGRSGLNPIVDNNAVSKKDSKNQRLGSFGKNNAQKATLSRTRRPLMGDFARILSPPESFLAAARSMINTRVPEATPSVSTVSNDNRPEAAQMHWAVSPKIQDPVSKKERQNHGSFSVRQAKELLSVVSSKAQPIPARHVDKIGTVNRDSSSSPISSESSEEGEIREKFVATEDQVKQSKDLNISQPGSPRKPELQEHSTDAMSRPQTPRLEENVVLVDVSYTPAEARDEVVMTPSLEELRGLEFTQISDPSQSPVRDRTATIPDTQEDSSKEHKSSKWDNVAATDGSIDQELADEYRREIDIICQLMEETTLSDTFLTKLIECRKELEACLQRRQDALRAQINVEASQESHIPQAPTHKEPETVTQGSSTTTGDTPTAKAERNVPSPKASTPSPQSRLNAAAPQFYPKAFTEYRSHSHATSTDSTSSFQPARSRAVSGQRSADDLSSHIATTSPEHSRAPSNPLSQNHIFGDHLLPGASVRQTENSHIFGDHLLPGRRASSATRSVSSTQESIWSNSAVSYARPSIRFSLPPQYPKTANPNVAVFTSTNNLASPTTTPNLFPQRATTQPIALTLQPTNIPASITTTLSDSTQASSPMLESIHAPKTKPTETQSSRVQKKKSPVKQGLESSRFADPHWME